MAAPQLQPVDPVNKPQPQAPANNPLIQPSNNPYQYYPGMGVQNPAESMGGALFDANVRANYGKGIQIDPIGTAQQQAQDGTLPRNTDWMAQS